MSEAAVVDIDRPRCRPFSLGDVMILIVALALGLAIGRHAIITIVGAIPSFTRNSLWSLHSAVTCVIGLNLILLIFLPYLLPAFLILRLRRPRPPLRSILGQPGFAGCAAPVALCLVLQPLPLLAPSAMDQPIIVLGAPLLVSAAVPLAWVALIATGRWAPEPSWIDRLGLVLGTMWMIAGTAHVVLTLIRFFTQ